MKQQRSLAPLNTLPSEGEDKKPDRREIGETGDAWSPHAPQKPNEDHKDVSSTPK